MNTMRTLIRDVSGAYERARRSYQQEMARGNVERADAALSKMKLIEDCIDVREVLREWRQ